MDGDDAVDGRRDAIGCQLVRCDRSVAMITIIGELECMERNV